MGGVLVLAIHKVKWDQNGSSSVVLISPMTGVVSCLAWAEAAPFDECIFMKV